MDSLKQMMRDEIVEPLRLPEKYARYRIELPNGVLMYGPPGCGKTFIARKLAEELGYQFFEVGPASIGSPYIHESSIRIKQLFDSAARSAPAMIFVDEFEGLVPSRSALGGEQQHKSEEVNEWLVQIADCSRRRIIFVAATNEPWKIDAAVQRSGRLDKKIYVGPPDGPAIAAMLLYHLAGRPVASESGIRRFASEITGAGYSASDLKLLVDEAAKWAMRVNSPIGHTHLRWAASERVPPSITGEQEQQYLTFGTRGMVRLARPATTR